MTEARKQPSTRKRTILLQKLVVPSFAESPPQGGASPLSSEHDPGSALEVHMFMDPDYGDILHTDAAPGGRQRRMNYERENITIVELPSVPISHAVYLAFVRIVP